MAEASENVAQASRILRRPLRSENVAKASENAAEASENAAEASENVAEASRILTRPLTTWLS